MNNQDQYNWACNNKNTCHLGVYLLYAKHSAECFVNIQSLSWEYGGHSINIFSCTTIPGDPTQLFVAGPIIMPFREMSPLSLKKEIILLWSYSVFIFYCGKDSKLESVWVCLPFNRPVIPDHIHYLVVYRLWPVFGYHYISSRFQLIILASGDILKFCSYFFFP